MQADGQDATPRTPSAFSQLSTIGSQPPDIPDHELLCLIGRGAYGEVWLARNAIGTMRAVKIVHRQSFQRAEHFEREFKGLLKFEPLSRSHDGLVDVLQIGRRDEDGYFFYVMELADTVGSNQCSVSSNQSSIPPAPLNTEHRSPTTSYSAHTLRSELQTRTRLPPAECVSLALKLAAALEHLHANGLVHRDIKPSNIIFVNGEPKLADIGLVTAIDEAHSLVGTAGYIPPEGPGTPQADLYSLGKVLYEIALGKDRQDFPQLPPDLQSHPDYTALLELNEVILKACETDPRQRYASATALSEDLALLQRGQSVRWAHRVERGWCLARRGAAWMTAGAAAIALIVFVSRVRQPTTIPRVEKRSTNDVANRFYDQGKNYFDQFTRTDLEKAADCFQRAIQADPQFAMAYDYLATAYSWSSSDGWNPNWRDLPKAKEFALQALALDDSLAEPRAALGMYHVMKEWDWKRAEKEYKQAIHLNSSSPFCRLCYAEFLRMVGRTKEALGRINEARILDPHSRIINMRLASYLCDARRFEEALAEIEKARAMGVNERLSGVEQSALCALGRYQEAIESERKSRAATGESEDLEQLKSAVEFRGPTAYWSAKLDIAKKTHDIYWQACCAAQLRDTNRAIAALDYAASETNVWLTFRVMTDWRLDPVRSDPRFRAILKTMHLQ